MARVRESLCARKEKSTRPSAQLHSKAGTAIQVLLILQLEAQDALQWHSHKEKKSLRQPKRLRAIRKGSLTSKLARVSPKGPQT
eukprot:1152806-Pelagomonas_calceolata.AAC.3